jgi:hypothetical protein
MAGEYCWLVAGGWFVLREKYSPCSLGLSTTSQQYFSLRKISH